jgi:hypothetical protein
MKKISVPSSNHLPQQDVNEIPSSTHVSTTSSVVDACDRVLERLMDIRRMILEHKRKQEEHSELTQEVIISSAVVEHTNSNATTSIRFADVALVPAVPQQLQTRKIVQITTVYTHSDVSSNSKVNSGDVLSPINSNTITNTTDIHTNSRKHRVMAALSSISVVTYNMYMSLPSALVF